MRQINWQRSQALSSTDSHSKSRHLLSFEYDTHLQIDDVVSTQKKHDRFDYGDIWRIFEIKFQ